MSIQSSSRQQVATGGPAVREGQPRRLRPVVWWAAFGALAVLVQLYVYFGWITSDAFTPTPTGPDPVPDWDRAWAVILQTVFVCLAVIATGWIVRGCVKERRLTFDGKLWFGWVSLTWLDSSANYIRPTVLFSAQYVNFGTWDSHIPGWISRNGSLLPSAPLIEPTAYMFMFLVSTGGCVYMRALSRRWPGIGPVGLVGSWFVLMIIAMAAGEEFLLIRTGWVVWLTNIPGLTLWPGTLHQMPLLPDPILYGAVLAAVTAMRYYRDDRGQAFVERGLDRLAVGGKARTLVSTLSIVGFVSACMIFMYSIPAAALTLWTHEGPQRIPSYLRAGLCGEGTQYACPGPTVPILLPGVPSDPGRNDAIIQGPRVPG